MESELPRDRLPPEVYGLALRLGVDPRRAHAQVQLRQRGRMRQDDSAAWSRFRARQTIEVATCAFDWRARTGPLRSIGVRDSLVDGVGRLEVHALGLIPLARAGGTPEVTRGQLMRYLAELPWAPEAILFNRALRWRVEGAQRLVVGAGADEAAAEVTLTLDDAGLIAEVFAPDRPRAVDTRFVPTPWRGRFSDYRAHGGFTLPFAGAVGWELDGKLTVCWEGQLEEWSAQ